MDAGFALQGFVDLGAAYFNVEAAVASVDGGVFEGGDDLSSPAHG